SVASRAGGTRTWRWTTCRYTLAPPRQGQQGPRPREALVWTSTRARGSAIGHDQVVSRPIRQAWRPVEGRSALRFLGCLSSPGTQWAVREEVDDAGFLWKRGPGRGTGAPGVWRRHHAAGADRCARVGGRPTSGSRRSAYGGAIDVRGRSRAARAAQPAR